MTSEERNINFTESEIIDLKRGLFCLEIREKGKRDYIDLISKLNTFYD